MSQEINAELKERLPGLTVPQVCFNGEHLGGFAEVFKMNETGKLQELTKEMKKLEIGIESECDGRCCRFRPSVCFALVSVFEHEAPIRFLRSFVWALSYSA
jgi:hypothetical protein